MDDGVGEGLGAADGGTLMVTLSPTTEADISCLARFTAGSHGES